MSKIEKLYESDVYMDSYALPLERLDSRPGEMFVLKSITVWPTERSFLDWLFGRSNVWRVRYSFQKVESSLCCTNAVEHK